MDVAVLGIRVQFEGGRIAISSLRDLEVAGTKVELAAGRMGRRLGLAEIEARKMDAAMGASSLSVKNMAMSMGLSEAAAGKLSHALGALSIAGAIGFIGKETIQQTIEAQDAMAQLEAAVTSTGGAAGRTVQQLDELSMQLQKQTAYSDEAVKGAEKLLLTFDKIRGVEFDRATAAVTDLASRMGGDLEGAAIRVGKALQDPEHGLAALRKTGVAFSAAQIEVVKRLYETGHVAEGQRVILAALEHAYGGSAAAARDTLGGALAGLKNAFGDLFEVTKNGSQGTVDLINAITHSFEKSGLSMDTFMLNTMIGWNNITAAAQKFNNVMSIDLTKGLSSEIDRVKALNEKVDFDRNVEEARLRRPGKTGPAGGVGALGAEESQAQIDAAKRQHDANIDLVRDAKQAAEIAGLESKAQERLKIEYEATNKAIIARRDVQEGKLPASILDETLKAIDEEKSYKLLGFDRTLLREELKGAKDDVAAFMDQVTANGLASWRSFFDSVSQLFGKLMDRLKTLGEEAGNTYQNLGRVAIGIAGASAGYSAGQSLYSSSHGTAGNNVRGALGGALSGAASGAMMGAALGPIGAAAGAAIGGITGLVGGMLGMGSAAREAAKATSEAVKQIALSMASLRASVSGNSLDVDIAAVEADRIARTKAIEDAWSGGGSGSDRVVWRTQQEKELNALEDARIAKLREEYALSQTYAREDLEVRKLRAEGRTKEADALARQEAADREIAQAIADHRSDEYIATLRYVTGLELATNAMDKASTAALNMVQGYKLQARIFEAMGTSGSYGGYVTGGAQYRPPTSTSGSGNLSVSVVMPNGEVLGKAVIKDFARRQRLNDAELRTVLS